MAGATGVGGADRVCSGLVTGVLGMVPRWWRHRNIALKAQQTAATTPPAQTTASAPAVPLHLTTTRPFMEFDATWMLLGLPWPLCWAGWPRGLICASCAQKTAEPQGLLQGPELSAERAAGPGHRCLHRGRAERPRHLGTSLCAGQPVSPPWRVRPGGAGARAPARVAT